MTKEENRRQTAVALANLLRNARKEKGWTIYRLAKEAGLSCGHVSRIENALVIPTADILQRITQALDVCVSFPLEFVIK